MPPPTTTWILIADAAHGKVFETIGLGNRLAPVPSFQFEQDIPAAHDLERDRPPRSYDSVGDSRHAMEPRSDPRRKLKRAFAEMLAERLDAAVRSGVFDRLVVVAPPAMLGDLRDCFTRQVQDRIVAELPRDLVKLPPHELRANLADVIAV